MMISEFIIKKCVEHRVKHIFGVPGDYVLDLCDTITRPDNQVKFINTCNELNAGYAADAYARLKGLGVVVVTYGVGSLSLVNAVAGAHAENVPLLIISGAPAHGKLQRNAELHHMVNGYDTPFNIFKHITVARYQIEESQYAAEQINQAVTECRRKSQPVYLEIPEDYFIKPVVGTGYSRTVNDLPEVETDLREAVRLIMSTIEKSKRPLLFVGRSIVNTVGQSKVLDLIERISCPFITMITDKGVLPEDHSNFLGMWFGDANSSTVKRVFEETDLVINLGAEFNELNASGYEKIFKAKDTIHIEEHKFIHQAKEFNVCSQQVIDKLLSQSMTPKDTQLGIQLSKGIKTIGPTSGKLTTDRFFECLSSYLSEDDIVIADMGASLFGSVNMPFPKNISFIAQPFYGSIGYSIPAAIGASLAEPNRRVIVLVGDGALQVTMQAISTLLKFACRPILFVLNNDGYTIERIIKDGIFNDIQAWHYHKLPLLFGGKKGVCISSIAQLISSLNKLNNRTALTLLEVKIPKEDPGTIMGKLIGPAAKLSESST